MKLKDKYKEKKKKAIHCGKYVDTFFVYQLSMGIPNCLSICDGLKYISCE